MPFISFMSKTRRRLCLPPQPCNYFKLLWDQFYPNFLEIYFANHEQQKVAALLVLKYGNRVSSEALGWNDLYEKTSPNHFLFWNAIKIAYEEGYEIFDFGRTAKTNTGLMNFKSRWGTSATDLFQFSFQENTSGSPESTAVYTLIRYFCKIVPEKIMPLFGRVCYHHLA